MLSSRALMLLFGVIAGSVWRIASADPAALLSYKYCFAPPNPFLGASTAPPPRGGFEIPKANLADMALFVIAPNHNDRDGLNVNVGDVEAIAERINAVWKSPERLVIAISETGGCANCGWAASAFPTGSAHTLANKLSQLYKHDFEVRRAIPGSIFDSYTSMPAIVTGGEWKAPDSNFIGHNYTARPPDRIRTKLNRYASASLTRNGAVVSFTIVHLEPDPGYPDPGYNAAYARRVQILSLEYAGELPRNDADVSFLLGDYNVTLNNVRDKLTDDQFWIDYILSPLHPGASGYASWGTQMVPCSYISRGAYKLARMFNDGINIAEFPNAKSAFKLRPVAYIFDVDGAGLPAHDKDPLMINVPMRVQGIAHTILGVLFVAEGTPMSLDHRAKSPTHAGTYWCQKCEQWIPIGQLCNCIAK